VGQGSFTAVTDFKKLQVIGSQKKQLHRSIDSLDVSKGSLAREIFFGCLVKARSEETAGEGHCKYKSNQAVFI